MSRGIIVEKLGFPRLEKIRYDDFFIHVDKIYLFPAQGQLLGTVIRHFSTQGFLQFQ